MAVERGRLALVRFLGGLPTFAFLNGCLVHGDSCFRHQVNCLSRREQRQVSEPHFGDDFDNGFHRPRLSQNEGGLKNEEFV